MKRKLLLGLAISAPPINGWANSLCHVWQPISKFGSHHAGIKCRVSERFRSL